MTHRLQQKLLPFPGSELRGTLRSQEPLPMSCLGKLPGAPLLRNDYTFISSAFSPLHLHSLICWVCTSATQKSVWGTLLAIYNNHSLNSDTHALPILFLSPAIPHACNIAAMHFIIKIDFVSYGISDFLKKKSIPDIFAFYLYELFFPLIF